MKQIKMLTTLLVTALFIMTLKSALYTVGEIEQVIITQFGKQQIEPYPGMLGQAPSDADTARQESRQWEC